MDSLNIGRAADANKKTHVEAERLTCGFGVYGFNNLQWSHRSAMQLGTADKT
jgi:hypothetical protein